MALTAYDALALWQQANPPGTPVPRHLAAALLADHPGVRLPGVAGVAGGAASCTGGTRTRERERPAPHPRIEVIPEARMQAEAERTLWAWVKAGELPGYYHRPDRAPGVGEMAGLPDLVVAGPDSARCPHCGSAVGAVEIKTATGRVRPEQSVWLRAFGRRGLLARSVEAAVEFVRGGMGVRV